LRQPIFLLQKITKPNLMREKLRKTLSNKKAAHKLLVKLTPWVNFTNVLQAAFT